MKEKKTATHLLFFFYPKRPDKYRVGKTPQKTRVAADIETPYKRMKQMEGEWLLCDTCLSITAHEANSLLFLFFLFFVVLSTQYENTQRQKKSAVNDERKNKNATDIHFFSFPQNLHVRINFDSLQMSSTSFAFNQPARKKEKEKKKENVKTHRKCKKNAKKPKCKANVKKQEALFPSFSSYTRQIIKQAQDGNQGLRL